MVKGLAMKSVVFLALLFICAAAYSQSHGVPQFPLGLHNGMTAAELARIARAQQAEMVTRVDEHGVKSLVVYPKNLRFEKYPVESYTTEFFNDRLWGVNVALKGCSDFSEHHRILEELSAFLRDNFPGEVTSDKLTGFNGENQAKSIYILELKCKGILLTVISHRNANSTYSQWVTFTDLDPGRWSTAERIGASTAGE